MIVKDPVSTLLSDALYGSSFPRDANLLVHPGQWALTSLDLVRAAQIPHSMVS